MGASYDTVFAPWAKYAAARSVLLEDPYLPSILRSSALYAWCTTHGAEQFPDSWTPEVLERASNLWLVREFIAAIQRVAPKLETIIIRMRADIFRDRHGKVAADVLAKFG